MDLRAQFILTFINGCIATYIAFRQHILDKRLLRMSLYDKRFNVYTEIKNILSQTLTHGTFPENALNNIVLAKEEAVFLFGEDIVEYLNKLYKDGIWLNQLEKRISDDHLNQEQQNADAAHIGAIKERLTEEFKTLPQKFLPYMRI